MNKQNIMNRLKGFPLSIEQKQELLNIIEENSGGSGVSIPIIEVTDAGNNKTLVTTNIGTFEGSIGQDGELFTITISSSEFFNYFKDKDNVKLKLVTGTDADTNKVTDFWLYINTQRREIVDNTIEYVFFTDGGVINISIKNMF